MATQPVPDDILRETLAAIREAGGNKTNAARKLGIPRQTLQDRVDMARRRGLIEDEPRQDTLKPFSLADDLPDGERPLEELIQFRVQEYQRKSAARMARKLINIDVRIDGPIAISHFGDPHVDDPGSDLGLLSRHIDIVNRTEGMFGANVGDLQNLWIGRLARLYANQTTTATESWRLAEWTAKWVSR